MDLRGNGMFNSFSSFVCALSLYEPETLYGDANKDGFLSDLEIEEVGFMRKVYLTILLSHISWQPSVFLLFYSLCLRVY